MTAKASRPPTHLTVNQNMELDDLGKLGSVGASLTAVDLVF